MKKIIVICIIFCIILSSFSLVSSSKNEENYEIFLPLKIQNRPFEVGFTIGSPPPKCPITGDGSKPPLHAPLVGIQDYLYICM